MWGYYRCKIVLVVGYRVLVGIFGMVTQNIKRVVCGGEVELLEPIKVQTKSISAIQVCIHLPLVRYDLQMDE